MAIKYDGKADSGGYIMGISGSKNNAPTDINPFTGKTYAPGGYSVAQLQADRAKGTAMQANGTFQPPPQAPQVPQAPAFDQAAYMQRMQGQVNSIYDQQTAARTAQFNAQRDKALGLVNQQKAEVAPQYQSARNQSDVVSAQNVQRLREMMASNGLQSSGENVTANVGMQNARQNSLNGLNLQEQQTNNDFNRQITNINDPSQLNAMIADLEAQRSQALYDAGNQADEMAYNRSRDSISDQRYADETLYGRSRDSVQDARYFDETQYGRGRDSLADTRYQDETQYGRGQDSKQWDYQAGRDTVNDGRYTDETQYGRGRDAIEDKRYLDELMYARKQDALANSRRSSSGGGGSSSYGGSEYAPATKLPAKPTTPKIMTQQQYIDAFEEADARKNNTARVLPGSTDYIKKMQKLYANM